MKTLVKLTFAASMFLLLFALPNVSEAGNKEKGVEYTYTTSRLTPKQFTKGYHAEKREYSHELSSSTRKMIRKQRGSWWQRFLHPAQRHH